MHNNYFFLRQLSSQLKKELVGFSFGEIFSQSKNELIVSLYKDKEERFIKAHLTPQFCCLSFPESFRRAKRNCVDLFQDIMDLEIKDIVQIENDRSFYFEMGNKWCLLFKMHGNRSNIILFHNDKVHTIFNNNLKQDYNLKINDLPKQVSHDKKAFEIHEGDLFKIIPTLGKSFQPFLENKNYHQSDLDKRYQIVQELLEYLENPGFYVHYNAKGFPQLSLIKVHESDLEFKHPTGNINTFFRNYISISTLENEKRRLKNSLTTKIKKAESYINKSSQKLEQLRYSSNYKHLADLIMANLNQINPYVSEVELKDFYSQKIIKISLKSNLSPQLNAEKYYRKAKKQQIEIDALTANIRQKQEYKDNLIDQLSDIDKAKNFKKLKKDSTKQLNLPEPSFHKITYMDYEILVGKNAKKNEQLTFRVAKKEDLFLHAKDSPGSHVIIKKKGNQNFPKPVIEKAASFAAFYSKSKSETLCRVMYTPRKYVRKAKSAPAGTVIVEKEKVILAKSEKIPSYP